MTADEIRKPKALAEILGAILAVDPGKGPEELALEEFERASVRKALARLPADQCIAIEMYLAGWSLAETAQVLKRSTPAVKMLRLRGLARLRESWDRNADLRPGEPRRHTNREHEE